MVNVWNPIKKLSNLIPSKQNNLRYFIKHLEKILQFWRHCSSMEVLLSYISFGVCQFILGLAYLPYVPWNMDHLGSYQEIKIRPLIKHTHIISMWLNFNWIFDFCTCEKSDLEQTHDYENPGMWKGLRPASTPSGMKQLLFHRSRLFLI